MIRVYDLSQVVKRERAVPSAEPGTRGYNLPLGGRLLDNSHISFVCTDRTNLIFVKESHFP
jgi:hypothetical protein